MEPPRLPHPPGPPQPPPPPGLPTALAHLRSLLAAASSALAALPSPLLPRRDAARPTTATLASPPPPTAAAAPPPDSAVPLTLPAAPALYSDCPAVVRVAPDPAAPAPSLPAFLAAECADFSSASTAADSPNPSSPPLARVLPSELCLLRRELDSWGHRAPGSYSHAVARAAAASRSRAPRRWEAGLRRWLLARSPRFGVVIDAAVRDHVWVLVRLCLKAAAAEAEAKCSMERAHEGEGNRGFGVDPSAVMFECPRLVEGVSWLGAQLGVLYGEGNGRLFAAAAVREAVLRMALCLAVGVGDGTGGIGAEDAGGVGKTGNDAGDVVADPVFLNQVAAAIAALYETSSMEAKIKAMQAQRPPTYQLLLEYSQALERGHQERSKRPNYRAVLEYDGILSRRVENQESGRAKTREELLAEERDYKRRRTSYRGKKAKRNPTEILRDIIDEHMEEIKQAGGIGCLVEAPADVAEKILVNNYHGGLYQESFTPKSSHSYDKKALDSLSPFENSTLTDSFGRVSSRSRDTRVSHKNLRYENHGSRYQNKGSGNETDQSYSHQHESNWHQRNSNDTRNRKYKKDVSQSSDCTASSPRSERSSGIEYEHMIEGSNGKSRTSQKRHRSVSVTQDQFNDRYDPQSTYSDGDPSTITFYDSAEVKLHVYHDELHPREHHERKHYHQR
ncbi:hypothetical protein ACP4OV_020361 [Aristida adscensionis]